MNVTWYQRTYYGFLIGIVLLYPFSLKLTNAAILLLACNWLVWAIAKPGYFSWRKWMMWLLVGFFLLTAISVIYSANLKVAVFALEKKMSLLVFPLVIGSSPPIKVQQFKQLVIAGIATILAAMSFCLIAATLRMWAGEPGGFLWKDLTAPLNEFHPTYLSLYINFFIGWLIVQLFENRRTLTPGKKVLIIFVIAFFYLSLILLSSKIHILLGAGIPVICAVCYLTKNKLKFVIPSFVVIIAFGSFVMIKTRAGERFRHINTLSYELDAPVKTFNEFTIRLAIAECSWQILKKNMILGVGIGDVYDELDKVYREVDYKFGYLDQQNPHNEFLSQWLATGIIGIFLMIFVLTVLFSSAIRSKKYDFLILLLLFTVTFLLESVLERQKGIVLFALLTNMYVFSQKNAFHSFRFTGPHKKDRA